MRRVGSIMVSVFFGCTLASSQVSYLNRPDLLNQVESCLKYTYNFTFDEAREIQLNLSEITPQHPVPVFLEALIVYWENFPLTPEDKASDYFVGLMDRTIELAQDYSEDEEGHLEGIFFDLYGRALKAMYWADNGKPGKVIPDLGTMYRHTKEGFKLKEQFVEFYFSTGLYNYYIEAYPEAHPVYKPVVAFMQEGDKQLGLQQLDHAINHTVYLKVESMLFMSLIQLNYEEDLHTALLYAQKLHQEYPRNLHFQGLLITILLHEYRFEEVRKVLVVMEHQSDSYSEMIRTMAGAFMTEKEAGSKLQAEKGYKKTVKIAESIGPYADVYKAIGYMGLSRLLEQKGEHSEAKRYAHKASRHTVYKFILDEKVDVPM